MSAAVAWEMRHQRRLARGGAETNSIVMLSESAPRVTVAVSCVDGQLTRGREFFDADCANGLKWDDSNFIPLHFRVAVATAAGNAATPEEGMVAYQPEEVGIGQGDCVQPIAVGAVTVETDAL